MVTATPHTLTDAAIHRFAVAWYEALDQHDDLASVQKMLADDGLEMRFPEVTSYGHEGFAQWYQAVTTRFFDEVHTVRSVDVRSGDGSTAEVKVLVNWQCKAHDGQDAKSKWLGFDAYQTWTIVAGPTGPQIKIYTVDRMDAMPGSAAL
ncbi:MAG TPA: nuclear transport factor 2 family protein [Pseudonocardiaceae bacterium]|jgi:ketosteroid isomerase-like protein|nr:nuclear transport factor 2 family protein [Pseudonocardiaceae bacterium]